MPAINQKAIDTMASIPMCYIHTCINELNAVNDSTARYFTFAPDGRIVAKTSAVCFHQVHYSAGHANVKGLGIFFQGYGGFDKENANGNRWRDATEEDLLSSQKYPFVQIDHGHYNEVSLKWLEVILDPQGPFKALLPFMLEIDPVKVQERRAFIFPDVSLIPPKLAWCFAICSRLGFSNSRVLWRCSFLKAMGLPNPLALLIASGFEPQIVNKKPTGKIIKSYIGGYLGPDVTMYAGKFLGCCPDAERPFGEHKAGTYGSADVFKSGSMDLKNRVFDTWDDVIAYTIRRSVEQEAKAA